MTELPEGAERRPIPPGEVLRVYRIVRVSEPSDPALIGDLHANAERGRKPRGPEIRYPELHRGVSAFERRADAERRARQFRRLGGWIATLELDARTGAELARWGGVSHLTLWAPPEMLLAAVVDVTPVRQ